MKTTFSIVCALLIVFADTSSPLIKGNQSPYIKSVASSNEFVRFIAHRQQNGVMLNWAFSNPGNAVSFVIERSYDGSVFETICELPTTAGTGNRCQYKDNSVFPGYIYYRVSALMYDGTTISSQVEMVRIVRNG